MGITYLAPSSNPSGSCIRTYRYFTGQAVEVVNKPPGSYYGATVISHVADGSYVVRYSTLLDDDNHCFLTETVHPANLRPVPPPVVVSPAGFSPNQMVDAYDGDGWWMKTITARRRGSDYYHVNGDVVDRDVEYHSSVLRVHQDWIGGCWVLP